MIPVTGEATGWQAWSDAQAAAARVRHDRRLARLAREREAAEERAAARRAASVPAPAAREADTPTTGDDAEAKKRAIIEAALERARQKKAELAARGVAPKNVTGVSPAVQAQIDAAEARRRRLGLGGEPAATDGDDAADNNARSDTRDPTTNDKPH
jgi:electron transport complex protein RnfB